jgi:hypothetical protein
VPPPGPRCQRRPATPAGRGGSAHGLMDARVMRLASSRAHGASGQPSGSTRQRCCLMASKHSPPTCCAAASPASAPISRTSSSRTPRCRPASPHMAHRRASASPLRSRSSRPTRARTTSRATATCSQSAVASWGVLQTVGTHCYMLGGRCLAGLPPSAGARPPTCPPARPSCRRAARSPTGCGQRRPLPPGPPCRTPAPPPWRPTPAAAAIQPCGQSGQLRLD